MNTAKFGSERAALGRCQALALGLAIAFAAPPDRALAADESIASESARWPGADLFTSGTVSKISIQIAARDLEKLGRESRQFVPATVSEGGELYTNVAVHLKGSVGSFRPLADKPGLTLDFAKFQGNQRFHGLRRMHLNNSVEDPSYCNEALGSALFRAAGIPAPRVTRAVVFLNARRLGVYVLKEGFTEDFLSCYFKNVSGNLYEPDEGHDVNQHLKRTSVRARNGNRAALKALAEAALEPDPERRWKRLDQTLELARFIRLMALEVMLCHRDGYCLARNNFRVYEDLDTGKMVFFPHGMDQLFGSADLPWAPKMAGLVAKAVMDTPEGNERYTHEFKALFQTLFQPETLIGEVDQLFNALPAVAEKSELSSIQLECNAVKNRIRARHEQLEQQLKEDQQGLMTFTNGIGLLTNWVKVDRPAAGEMDEVTAVSGARCLHVRATAETSASWRTKARLSPGHYWFEGKVRVSRVQPLGFGAHHGAGLRLAGQVRQAPDLVGDSGWNLQRELFEVGPDGAEVEFICEFRARGGEAWFDLSSLRVVQAP